MNDVPARAADDDLENLIVRHLDGGLDAEEQRRLARLLAASLPARRTLASYMRLEGAAFRLAAARGLARPAEAAGRGNLLRGHVVGSLSGRRRLGLAAAALAVGSLAMLLLASLPARWPGGGAAGDGDLDLVATQWLRQSARPAELPDTLLAPADEPPGGSPLTEDADPDEPRNLSPPSWLVVAMAAAAADITPSPDEG